MSRPNWSIRARVIAAVLALTGVALAFSGLIVALHARDVQEQQVSADLRRVADEFGNLAREGLDPATGQRFADAGSLLRVAVQRAVLAPNEGVLAVVGGRLRWTAQAAVPLRPEADPAFVAHVLPLADLDVVSQGRLVTPVREYRYLVVPVHPDDGTSGGALVRAVDVAGGDATLTDVWRSYVLVAGGSLLLVGLLIWILVGRLLEPIATMRRTAERISETDLSGRIDVRGSDDLSALGVTMNGMLDRLEGAVGAQRDLLDDVGHELRTPLTIIRGHLELLDPADADDVAATRVLLLDEADRMRRLVDDLLALARAERPELLQPEPTDVARLTDETLAKATGLGQRRWVLDELADIEVVLDPQRVAQGWLQLAANAVRYSADGSEVGMGSRVRDHELWLWVRDQGTGISPADRDRILTRSVRGTDAGAGLGLGLAIVAAIGRAHGGRLDIVSAPNEGSTISLVLPVREDHR